MKDKKKKTKTMIATTQKQLTKGTFLWHDVEFPNYFKNPRWVQVGDRTFTIAIDSDLFTDVQTMNWNTKGLYELAELGKQVLENLTKDKVGSL